MATPYNLLLLLPINRIINNAGAIDSHLRINTKTMSNRSNFVQKWILGICLLAVSSMSIALDLNGIASFKQLRKEYYIAALYLATPSDDSSTIINSNGTQRMVIKVTTDKWSPRRWALTWQDNIAINNDLSAHPELLETIMAFTQFPKSKLTQGDQLIIDYSPAFGTVIKLNGFNVVKTEDKTLFNFMLNTWLGKLPPSQEFKQRILSQQKDSEEASLKARFDSLQLSVARKNTVASWISADQEKEAARLAAIEAKKAQAQKEKQNKAYQAALAKQKAQQQAKAKQQQLLAEKKRKADQEKKQQLAKARATAKAQREAERKRAQAEAEKQAQAEQKSKKIRAEEQNYYFAHYQWELQRDATNRVSYPVWAAKFGQQGLVKLSAKVNESGEIIELNHHNESVSQLLKQEAERALRESASYIFPPAELSGESWNVFFEYDFNLNNAPQNISAKPQRPASLQTKKLNQAAYAKLKNDYVKQALEGIKIFIEYPESARVLRHKGEVTLSLTVDSSGQLLDIQDKKASRYSTLNQQLRSAIESALPLPPIPDELRATTLSFDVSHHYKH